MFKVLKFASRLRDLRTQEGMTQRDLAGKAGLSVAAVCKFETGQMTPTASSICKLCEVFGVSADYLIGRTDSP